MAKIPNRTVMRDFLVNKGKFYCPPTKLLTKISKVSQQTKNVMGLEVWENSNNAQYVLG